MRVTFEAVNDDFLDEHGRRSYTRTQGSFTATLRKAVYQQVGLELCERISRSEQNQQQQQPSSFPVLAFSHTATREGAEIGSKLSWRGQLARRVIVHVF